jgi:hypothetical protein
LRPSIQPRARIARLLVLSAVVAAFAASAMAASASAAQPTYTFYLDLRPTGSYAAAWLNTPSSSSSLIELIRGGAVIAWHSSTSSDAAIDYAGALQAGDVVRFSTGGASSSVTFDGMPTIDSGACAASRTVTGTVSPGATSLYVGSAMGNGSAGSNPATSSRSGSSYTATFNAPLAAGARVYTSADQTVNNGDASFSVTRELPVAASCPSSGAPGGGGATPTDGGQTPSQPQDVTAQIVSALNAALGRQRTLLGGADPIKIAKAGFVDVPFEFVAPGSVTFTWQAGLLPGGKAAMAARAKAKRTVIARGTARSTTVGKGSARVRLTAAGRRLLRTAKAVKITLIASFVPASGGPVQQGKTTVTLRRHAKGAKH